MSELNITTSLREISSRLTDAAAIAKGAVTCAEAGSEREALRIAMNLDELLSEAQTLHGAVCLIGQGRSWLEEITAGTTPNAIASRQRCSERNVRNTLSLAFLSPTIVTAIVDGRLTRGIGLSRLADLPPSWVEQHQTLGI